MTRVCQNCYEHEGTEMVLGYWACEPCAIRAYLPLHERDAA